MPTCRNCRSTHETEELTRHTIAEWVVVHCPDCHAPMGRYRVGAPAVDKLQNA
ncbi:hypothetical protein [Haloferax profundi]|uniref:hypothetical protein n=1 Tax=Haloferax profundi TaxID=1544718 RepID=UPI000A88FF92|nr:hypothetical protein [Haloferax profundi]